MKKTAGSWMTGWTFVKRLAQCQAQTLAAKARRQESKFHARLTAKQRSTAKWFTEHLRQSQVSSSAASCCDRSCPSSRWENSKHLRSRTSLIVASDTIHNFCARHDPWLDINEQRTLINILISTSDHQTLVKFGTNRFEFWLLRPFVDWIMVQIVYFPC